MTAKHTRLMLGATFWIWIACAGACHAAAEPPTPIDTAAAFYDAGNAQARQRHWAPAVLDYERARLLAPNDPDLAANLRQVRQGAGLPPQPRGWLRAHERLASPNTMYGVGLIGLLALGSSLVALRGARRWPGPVSAGLRAVAVLGGLLTLLGVSDAIAVNPLLQEYVVLETSPATGSPVTNGDPLFTVSQADVVEAREHHRGFLLVKDSQGRQGWVARTRLTAVVPERDAATIDD